MTMPALTRMICLLLVLSTFTTGCAFSARPPLSGQAAKTTVISSSDVAPPSALLGKSHSLTDPSTDCSRCQALQKAGRQEYRTAAWIIFGVIVAIVVIADIFLLPAYHRSHNSFPCCRAVYVVVVD